MTFSITTTTHEEAGGAGIRTDPGGGNRTAAKGNNNRSVIKMDVDIESCTQSDINQRHMPDFAFSDDE